MKPLSTLRSSTRGFPCERGTNSETQAIGGAYIWV
jgi:hypothetical protein